jgi:hypothetical protein
MGVKRVIKLGIISFVVFFILLWLMSLLFPSHVRISRAININAPMRDIVPLLRDTGSWKTWMEMEIDSIKVTSLPADTASMSTEWHYGGRTIKSSFSAIESADITVVQWYFDFHLKWYPWEKLGSITFDKQFGTPMELSLNKLKKVIEKSP